MEIWIIGFATKTKNNIILFISLVMNRSIITMQCYIMPTNITNGVTYSFLLFASLDYCATVFSETGYVKNSFCKRSGSGILQHPGCQDTHEYATLHNFFTSMADYFQSHGIIGPSVKYTNAVLLHIIDLLRLYFSDMIWNL